MPKNIYGHIYGYMNMVNQKWYIGFTTNFEQRHRAHKCFSGGATTLYDAVKKYGWENFSHEILYSSWDAQHCYEEMENYFIEKYNSIGKGYNSCRGGKVCVGSDFTKSRRMKISQKLKGRVPWNKGLKTGPLSQATKEKLVAVKTGKRRGPYKGRKEYCKKYLGL